jgi:hypothetical protein
MGWLTPEGSTAAAASKGYPEAITDDRGGDPKLD